MDPLVSKHWPSPCIWLEWLQWIANWNLYVSFEKILMIINCIHIYIPCLNKTCPRELYRVGKMIWPPGEFICQRSKESKTKGNKHALNHHIQVIQPRVGIDTISIMKLRSVVVLWHFFLAIEIFKQRINDNWIKFENHLWILTCYDLTEFLHSI